MKVDVQHLPPSLVNALYKGDHERPERVAVRQSLRRDDRVLEIGAGVGLISLACAQIVGEENLLSYEANENLVPIIRKNFEINGMNANIRAKAVTAYGQGIAFHVSDRIVDSSSMRNRVGQTVSVQSDAIGDVIAEFKPTALVIDAEGGEVEILEAAPLEMVRVIILEVHPHVVGSAAIDNMLLGLERRGLVETCRNSDTFVLKRSAAKANANC